MNGTIGTSSQRGHSLVCKKCNASLEKCTNCDVLNFAGGDNCRKCGHSMGRNYRLSKGGFAAIQGYFEANRCPACHAENYG